MKSSSGRKRFFQFPCLPLRGKQTKLRSSRSANRKSLFATFQARKSFKKNVQQIEFSSKSVSFGSMLSLVSTTGVVEVHSLGDSTVIFASCDAV